MCNGNCRTTAKPMLIHISRKEPNAPTNHLLATTLNAEAPTDRSNSHVPPDTSRTNARDPYSSANSAGAACNHNAGTDQISFRSINRARHNVTSAITAHRPPASLSSFQTSLPKLPPPRDQMIWFTGSLPLFLIGIADISKLALLGDTDWSVRLRPNSREDQSGWLFHRNLHSDAARFLTSNPPAQTQPIRSFGRVGVGRFQGGTPL